MFEDESSDSMKAVTVSDFYLFDALLFDLCKAVETIKYNILAILVNSRAFNLTFNTAQEYCLTILFWERRIPGSKFNSPVQNQHHNSWKILFPSARASSRACKNDLILKTLINYYIIPILSTTLEIWTAWFQDNSRGFVI